MTGSLPYNWQKGVHFIIYGLSLIELYAQCHFFGPLKRNIRTFMAAAIAQGSIEGSVRWMRSTTASSSGVKREDSLRSSE
jgi:hypothetical protein